MLELMRKGQLGERDKLSEAEDLALRRAFGRFALRAAREAGVGVVRARQMERGGQWFACDCLGAVAVPPVLVPVAEMHVRRHVEGPWPEHAEQCDFYQDADEQRAVSASYARPVRSTTLKLVRSFAPGRADTRVGNVSNGRRRSSLAQLLMALAEASGLTRVEAGAYRHLAAQFEAVRAAAREVELEPGVSLARYLCTYGPGLPEFMGRIAQAKPSAFPRTKRPHGILLTTAASASAGVVHPLRGEPFQVSGGISIFGEEDGHAAGRAALARRAPYLTIAVVGRRQADGPVEVLRAYLHPCMSASWLLPVDSDYERHTLKQLLSVGHWLAEGGQTRLTIVKPVFDMAPVPLVCPGEETEPHEPILPDFLVRSSTGGQAVVETMGYDLPAYRERKARLHPAMRKVCDGAQLVEHDFSRPVGSSQEDRDRAFRRACRDVLVESAAPVATSARLRA